MPRFTDQAGNVWEAKSADDPNPVLIQAAGGGVFIPEQVDPTARYQAPQAAADLARTQASTASSQIDARVAQATAPAEINKAQADARKAEAEAAKIESGRDLLSPTERANAIAGYQSAIALEGIIADLEQKYRDGPGATKGVYGALDYIDSKESNQRFNQAANAARGIVGQALGFTGGQLNSVSEAQMNVGPYIPQAGDKDGSIEDAIERLRDLKAQAESRSIAILGGRPDENGNIIPLAPQERPNALTYTRTDSRGPEMEAAGFDATERAVPYPPEFVAAHDALVQRLAAENGGRIPPDVYAREKAKLATQFNYASSAEADKEWAGNVNQFLDDGGTTIPTGMTPETREMTGFEQVRNRATSGTGGAALAGYLNSAGFGIPEALTGANMDYIRDENPLASIGGEIGGAITGTAGLGKVGRGILKASGRQGPQSAFVRNAITDTAYGAGYGTATEGDPLTGAVLGAVGSGVGQGLGKVAETAIGGVRATPAVERLRQAGVNLTPGRILGEAASRTEDKLVSLLVVGDLLRRRQQEGMGEFAQAAFNEGLAPIGVTARRVGEEGVEDGLAATSQAFNDTFAGRNIVPDAQYTQTVDGAVARGSTGRFGDDFMEVMDNNIAPIYQPDGSLAGRGIQDLLEVTGDNARYYNDLAAGRVGAGVREPQARPVASAFGQISDGTEDLITRQAPDILPRYQAAKEAFRNMKVLQDATHRARNGTRSGEVNIPSPSQIADAAAANAKAYGRTQGTTQQPFRELTRAGQEVLPSSVPNSGTTDRALLASIGLPILGAGGAEAYSTEGAPTTTLGTAALALGGLAALNTRAGNRVFQTIALDRPDAAKLFAEGMRKRRGLFGTAAVPIALQAQ